MPYSYPLFKEEVKQHILEHTHENSNILDIGIGSGIYSDLLKHHRNNMDGVEIFLPYIEQFGLTRKYNTIYNQNILTLDQQLLLSYDYFIMGDVVEHLSYDDAIKFLTFIHTANKKMLVAVPYMYPQGEHYGNVHETHLQPDLTEQVVELRYPMLQVLFSDANYGYFVNYI
jgi:hypothetical protein